MPHWLMSQWGLWMQGIEAGRVADAAVTVLLVDDQAIIGEAVRRLLSAQSGFAFHFCADAALALETAIRARPTVILQDLVMPQTDGLTLVQAYRADPVTAAIPIIVLSTKEDPKVKSAAFAAGANDYLVKLPDALELVARIRYHSRSYLALRERDEAARALQQSQKQLLETHQELRVLLDTVPTGILKLDGTGRILQGNYAAQALLKLVGGQLDGRSFTDMLTPGSQTGFSERLAEALQGQGNSTRYTEADLRQPHGGNLPIEYLVTPLPSARGIELSLVIRDITERKAADLAKNEFIATVSHELRTPLTSIRGALGLILGGKLGELPEKAMRMLDVANRNSERLTQLINDILDLEKITTRGMDFNVVMLTADGAMETAVAANEGYGLRHDVRLRIVRQAEGVRILADELRLQQVFANLISNAVKYSPAGKSVELAADLEGDRIRFRIRDYGPGIPEEFRERIFNRFSQANSSDARARGGTGLGLNIARSIVEQLGGEVGFTTSAAGTEFSFLLPVAGG
ncbi:PAS domain S-box-containing protein [Fluviicoccus keumensis]|uniref:histidine kinase n=1 Tax=Fluviicoccus keumensis TaxID=1435465 RepID=A0A4Q7ZC36_9GAMM|nr:ATP-binding protein [Fluviicoccus keumensis]RZU47691.1 PAS domain S-box-containing protein [Fluviicoccus keumensis]